MKNCSSSSNLLVAVDELSFHYFGHESLFQGLSFSVCRGEELCVLGPPTAGKTTLMRLLAGYLSPVEGSILYQTCTRIVALAPIASPAEFITLHEYSIYKANEFDVPIELADEALDVCGLKHLQKQQLRRLSSSYRQSVSMAILLLSKADLLLLDAYPGGRDSESQEVIKRLKQNYLERGGSIIFTSRKEKKKHSSFRILKIHDYQ